jgi:hypothetical protein
MSHLNRYWLSFTDMDGRLLGLTLLESWSSEEALYQAYDKGLVKQSSIVSALEVDSKEVGKLSFSLDEYLNKFLGPAESIQLTDRIEQDFLS